MSYESSNSFSESTKVRIAKPKMFRVIFFNDDFTTMDFVVYILTTVFLKPLVEAETLMKKIHKEGSAIVGIYTYDIAVSRITITYDKARENGFPLKAEIEEA